MLAPCELHLIQYVRPKRWRTVVDAVRCVQCNENVVIDVPWVGVRRGAVAVSAAVAVDLPRPGTEEPLTRHSRKRADHSLRIDRPGEAQLFGVPGAHLLEHDGAVCHGPR
jgi:hypothetical protein